MRFAKSARCAFVVVLVLACFGTGLRPAAAAEPDKAQIDALRKSLEKYKDYKVAVREACRGACNTEKTTRNTQRALMKGVHVCQYHWCRGAFSEIKVGEIITSNTI